MDMDTFSVEVFGAVAFFLLLNVWYQNQHLKKYVDRHYPEEGKIVRLYEWQWYPWSVGHRTLMALIKKERANDPELARRARNTKRAVIYFIAWPIVMFLIDYFIFD